MNKPYVGVTGPVSIKDVEGLMESFDTCGYSMKQDHIPMVGVLVSHKTLETPTVSPMKRYPIFNDVPKLLEQMKGRVFPTIHYNTKIKETMSSQLERVFGFKNIYENNLCRAVQLNIPWPYPREISGVKEVFPELKVILQLSSKSMDGMNNDEVVKRVSQDYPNVEYILIDPSGGSGVDFDIEKSVDLFKRFKESGIKSTIGFAGGLSGNSVRRKVDTLKEILGRDDFSIDAEGKLRDKITDEWGDDNLNLEKAKKYIAEASIALL